MTCREMVLLLLAYVEGELTPEQRHELEQHACECPPCGVYVETYRITVRVGQQMRCEKVTPKLPGGMMERFLARVQAERPSGES